MSCLLAVLLLLLLAITTVYTHATLVTITSPSIGTIWSASTEVSIRWEAADPTNAPLSTLAPLRLELVHGDPNASRFLGILVTAPRESDGAVRFILTGTLPTSNQYRVKAGMAYSPLFTVMNEGLGRGVVVGNGTTVTEVQPVVGGRGGTNTGSGGGASPGNAANNGSNTTSSAAGRWHGGTVMVATVALVASAAHVAL